MLTVGVQMPEAAVDEDDASAGAEDEVGGTGKALVVEAIAVSQGMDKAANPELRRGVLAANAAHIFRAAGGIETVQKWRNLLLGSPVSAS